MWALDPTLPCRVAETGGTNWDKCFVPFQEVGGGRMWGELEYPAQEVSKNEQGVIQPSGDIVVARGGPVRKGKCD